MIKKRLYNTESNRFLTGLVVVAAFFYFGYSLMQTQTKLKAIEKQEMVDWYELTKKMVGTHVFGSYIVENETYENQDEFLNEYRKITPYMTEQMGESVAPFALMVHFFTSKTLPSEFANKRALVKEQGYFYNAETHRLSLMGSMDNEAFVVIQKTPRISLFGASLLDQLTIFLGLLFGVSLGALFLGYREMSVYRKKKEVMENEYLHLEEDAKKLAFVDTLTGVSTRLKLAQSLSDLIENAKRFVQPFSLILCDLDHFKRINDTYGHDYGDVVLKMIARCMKENLRENDIVARWGGEEFIIILPMAQLKAGIKTAEKLRQTVAKLSFEKIPQMTCSFGVIEYVVGEDEEHLFKRVDLLLYEAKKSGRNCIKYEKKVAQC